MADPQTLIREAQEKAERLCRLAVAQTPAEYHSFITLIDAEAATRRFAHAQGFRVTRTVQTDGTVRLALGR